MKLDSRQWTVNHLWCGVCGVYASDLKIGITIFENRLWFWDIFHIHTMFFFWRLLKFCLCSCLETINNSSMRFKLSIWYRFAHSDYTMPKPKWSSWHANMNALPTYHLYQFQINPNLIKYIVKHQKATPSRII